LLFPVLAAGTWWRSPLNQPHWFIKKQIEPARRGENATATERKLMAARNRLQQSDTDFQGPQVSLAGD
jgi:hypothetical protein